MNTVNISQKAKNKHLDFSHYEFIINSLIQFNASHPGKRNIGKTQFIRDLASTVGTTVSNCKSQYKNVGLGQYKNVGFPTFLYCLFSLHLL